jgi:Family of unknown function (DUF5763)
LFSQCRANKRGGERCTLPAKGADGYCWAHSPEHADRRKRAASRAGRSKPSREVRTIKEEIQDAIAGVKDGSLDRNIARAMFQGFGVLLDYIKLERGVYVEEELAARLEALKRDDEGNAAS